VSLLGIVATALGSAALSAVAVAVSIRIAHRTGALDHPDGGRKTQGGPIPRLGGLAVALSYCVVVLAICLAVGGRETALLAAAVVVPALLAAAIGLADDRAGLSPWTRLAAQGLVGLVAWAAGTRISATGMPVVDAALLLAWFLVIINGVNLLDNTDGLAGSTVLVAAVGGALVAALNGQHLVSLMGVSLAGVAAGFLWHNWFPATVYLGDSGAYFLGTLLAILTVRIRPSEAPPAIGVAIAVLLALLPIVDTCYVIVTRARQRVHPFTAGRDHLSHRLQSHGFSIPLSVLALQGIGLAGSIAAVALALAA
jgi:UDP-GlcNAc:undecaprenyl-phosphate GlcNAc-1-phosphate transferase